eukprot:jgi/Chrzof1/12263/Cz06g27190.t1
MVQLSMPCLHTHKIPLLQHRHSHCYCHSSNISICKHHLIGFNPYNPLVLDSSMYYSCGTCMRTQHCRRQFIVLLG